MSFEQSPSIQSPESEPSGSPSVFDPWVRGLNRLGLLPRGIEDFDDLKRLRRRLSYPLIRRLFRYCRAFLFQNSFQDVVLTRIGERRQRWLEAMAASLQAKSEHWSAQVFLVQPPSLEIRHSDGWSDVIEFRGTRRPAMAKNRFFGVTLRSRHSPTPEFKARVDSFFRPLTEAALDLSSEPDFPRYLTSQDPAVIHYLPSAGRAEFRPSLSCNHHCGFCNSVSRDSTDNAYGKRDFIRLLDQLEPLPLVTIAISGGEPTLLHDLPKLVGLASNRGYRIELQTNGMALADLSYARRIRKAGVTRLLISLHSSDPVLSDTKITQYRGGWEKTIAGIDHAIDQGFSVEISYVTHVDNLEGTRDFFGFVARKWGRKVHIRFAYVAPTGGASDDIDRFVPDMAVAAPHLRDAFAYARTMRLRITVVAYCGIPPCLLGAGARYSSVVKHWSSFDENHNHTLLQACDTCFYKKRCPGLWKSYYDRFGDPGLKPLRIGARHLS